MRKRKRSKGRGRERNLIFLANEGGVSEAPSESVVFTAPNESSKPEDFTSQSNGVERETSVIFTPLSRFVMSKLHIFASSTRAAGESHIQKTIIDFGKSMINESGIAVEKETGWHFIKSGMNEIGR